MARVLVIGNEWLSEVRLSGGGSVLERVSELLGRYVNVCAIGRARVMGRPWRYHRGKAFFGIISYTLGKEGILEEVARYEQEVRSKKDFCPVQGLRWSKLSNAKTPHRKPC